MRTRAPLDSFTSRGDQFEHVESCSRGDMASSTDALTDAQEVERLRGLLAIAATLGQSLISQQESLRTERATAEEAAAERERELAAENAALRGQLALLRDDTALERAIETLRDGAVLEADLDDALDRAALQLAPPPPPRLDPFCGNLCCPAGGQLDVAPEPRELARPRPRAVAAEPNGLPGTPPPSVRFRAAYDDPGAEGLRRELSHVYAQLEQESCVATQSLHTKQPRLPRGVASRAADTKSAL